MSDRFDNSWFNKTNNNPDNNNDSDKVTLDPETRRAILDNMMKYIRARNSGVLMLVRPAGLVWFEELVPYMGSEVKNWLRKRLDSRNSNPWTNSEFVRILTFITSREDLNDLDVEMEERANASAHAGQPIWWGTRSKWRAAALLVLIHAINNCTHYASVDEYHDAVGKVVAKHSDKAGRKLGVSGDGELSIMPWLIKQMDIHRKYLDEWFSNEVAPNTTQDMITKLTEQGLKLVVPPNVFVMVYVDMGRVEIPSRPMSPEDIIKRIPEIARNTKDGIHCVQFEDNEGRPLKPYYYIPKGCNIMDLLPNGAVRVEAVSGCFISGHQTTSGGIMNSRVRIASATTYACALVLLEMRRGTSLEGSVEDIVEQYAAGGWVSSCRMRMSSRKKFSCDQNGMLHFFKTVHVMTNKPTSEYGNEERAVSRKITPCQSCRSCNNDGNGGNEPWSMCGGCAAYKMRDIMGEFGLKPQSNKWDNYPLLLVKLSEDPNFERVAEYMTENMLPKEYMNTCKRIHGEFAGTKGYYCELCNMNHGVFGVKKCSVSIRDFAGKRIYDMTLHSSIDINCSDGTIIDLNDELSGFEYDIAVQFAQCLAKEVGYTGFDDLTPKIRGKPARHA
jgi:hypothetical protein